MDYTMDYPMDYPTKHARLLCPSLTPGAYSNSRESVGDAIQPSHSLLSLLLLPSIFPSIRVFSSESALHIRWPKYWSFSFSISLSNEYSGLISVRIDWFDLLAVQETLRSLLTSQFKSINSLALSFLYGPTFTSIPDYWKDHSFDYTDQIRSDQSLSRVRLFATP